MRLTHANAMDWAMPWGDGQSWRIAPSVLSLLTLMLSIIPALRSDGGLLYDAVELRRGRRG
jgi:hypothetical protein